MTQKRGGRGISCEPYIGTVSKKLPKTNEVNELYPCFSD